MQERETNTAIFLEESEMDFDSTKIKIGVYKRQSEVPVFVSLTLQDSSVSTVLDRDFAIRLKDLLNKYL